MQRVVVLGCAGAGKSTLATRLAAITGLPLVPLDRAFWRPGWQEPPRAEWRHTVAGLCQAPAWIMDGNYSGTLDIRLARADTAIWLDYPRHVCLRRALWRAAATHGRVRPDMAEGCPERFDLEFLRYVWNFNARYRPRLVAALENHGAHVRLHRLETSADAERLLRESSKPRAAFPDIPAGEP
jgi:adenylate kinase family enzyme